MRRDGKGRPLLLTACDTCDGSGRMLSDKGNSILCKRRCEQGLTLKPFTRVTTYIDVLDDKSNLTDWFGRMVLLGCATEPSLLKGVGDIDPNTRNGKDVLNGIAKRAKEAAGGNAKANLGTHRHEITEALDKGEEIDYAGLNIDDIIALNEYAKMSALFRPVMIEELLVCDELGVAGTPDRIEQYGGDVPLVTPDGKTIGSDERIITDLKTGSLYGGLKMAMQLAIYSRSQKYNDVTGERSSVGNVNTEWGIIKHLPPEGKPGLYWADLTLGWEAVLLAGQVREMRQRGRSALSSF